VKQDMFARGKGNRDDITLESLKKKDYKGDLSKRGRNYNFPPAGSEIREGFQNHNSGTENNTTRTFNETWGETIGFGKVYRMVGLQLKERGK